MVTYACLSNTLLLTGMLVLGLFSKPELILCSLGFRKHRDLLPILVLGSYPPAFYP